jgi:hypothetical protein
MQHPALRRLTDQFLVRGLDRLGDFFDDLPLRGSGQRNTQLIFQTIQPIERNAAAVLELRDHRRRGLVILMRSYPLRFLGREHLAARIAAEPFQFIHRGG